MTISPIIRYMLICEDWRLHPTSPNHVTIIGLISNLHSLDDPPFPLLYRELCVFLALTEGRGQGTGQIVCTYEETGQRIFETGKRTIQFSDDPLDVFGVPFRILDCPFPFPGMYSIQFWYNGMMVDERPLRLR